MRTTSGTVPSYQPCNDAYGEQLLFENVVIGTFGIGLGLGNHAYLDTFRNVTFQFNRDGVLAMPSGDARERMVFSECLFGNNTESNIVDQQGYEWMINNTSFDYNFPTPVPLGPAISISSCSSCIGAGHLYLSNSHVEYAGTPSFPLIYVSSGTPNINILNTTFLLGSVGTPAIMGTTSGATVSAVGGFAWNAAGAAVPLVTGTTNKTVAGMACTNVSGC